MAKNSVAKVSKLLQEFFLNQSTSGYALIVATLLSIYFSNSSFGESYHQFWSTKIGGFPEAYNLSHSLKDWINDGLMSLFFLLVGIEIKRELVDGELKNLKVALWPVFGALGGMVIPAMVYLILNVGSAGNPKGFGIPMATDIAFVIAVMGLLGKSIPTSLKIFLTALAIIDDLGAIVVIALFYGGEIHWLWIGISVGICFIIWFLSSRQLIHGIIYLLGGLLLWYSILLSGVNATLSGVILAILLPRNSAKSLSLTNHIEHLLNRPVSWVILPMFAMANTAISFGNFDGGSLLSPISLGVILGLTFGKPVGIVVGSWLAVRTKLAKIPNEVHWRQILGAGMLGGIGFTMSIFIANLAFDRANDINISKLSIISGTLLSITVGVLILIKSPTKKNDR